MPSKKSSHTHEGRKDQHPQTQLASCAPPQTNVFAAVNHIRDLFESKKWTYGILGGFALVCLGSNRPLFGAEFAYNDRDFNRIRAKLEADKRVELPEGMNPLFPAKIRVNTGPIHKDQGCSIAASIDIHLIPPGSYGSPQSGNLEANLVLLSLKTEGKTKTYRGLNILHLLTTSVHYCGIIGLPWHPHQDVLFLCQNYSAEIQAIRRCLDQQQLQKNFFAAPFFSHISFEDQRRCSQSLLGRDPSRAPAPKHTGSASTLGHEELSRPRLASHSSSPTLNQYNNQLHQEFRGLAPSRPPNQPAHDSPLPTIGPQLSMEQPGHYIVSPIAPGSSRGKYSPTHQGGQQLNIDASQSHHGSRRKSIDPRHPQQSQPLSNRSHLGMRPHGAVTLAPNPMPARVRKSMPDLGKQAMPASDANFQTPSNVQPALPPFNTGAYPQPRQHPGQQVGVESSRSPLPEVYMHLVSPKGEASLCQLPDGYQEAPRRLHVVGAEGIYQPLETNMHSLLLSQNFHSYLPNQVDSAPVFELDASSQPAHFIAELSAERSTPAPRANAGHSTRNKVDTETTKPLHVPPQELECKASTHDSPVDPPDEDHHHRRHGVSDHTQQLNHSERPLDHRTHSAPAGALPTSLTIRGSGIVHPYRASSIGMLPVPALEAMQQSLATTNVARYSTVFAHPASTANRQLPSSAPPHNNDTSIPSMYRAYQPPPPTVSPPTPLTQIPHVSYGSHAPVSPEDETTESLTFGRLKDVDGAGQYFRGHHKRDASHDSHASSASHDSRELAREYQAVIGELEDENGEGKEENVER